MREEQPHKREEKWDFSSRIKKVRRKLWFFITQKCVKKDPLPTRLYSGYDVFIKIVTYNYFQMPQNILFFRQSLIKTTLSRFL
jgi:hypothetical protein